METWIVSKQLLDATALASSATSKLTDALASNSPGQVRALMADALAELQSAMDRLQDATKAYEQYG